MDENTANDISSRIMDACNKFLDDLVNSGIFDALGIDVASALNKKDEDVIEVYEVKHELGNGSREQ